MGGMVLVLSTGTMLRSPAGECGAEVAGPTATTVNRGHSLPGWPDSVKLEVKRLPYTGLHVCMVLIKADVVAYDMASYCSRCDPFSCTRAAAVMLWLMQALSLWGPTPLNAAVNAELQMPATPGCSATRR